MSFKIFSSFNPHYLNSLTLKSGSICKEIFRLSLPTIVSNITVPLLGICDTAISGHLGSELFLSSIAVGTVMLNVVFWIFGFLRGGTTGLTANAFGAASWPEIVRLLYQSLLISAVAGAVLICLQVPIFRFLWLVAGSGGEIIGYVEEYFDLRVWGSPALLATMAISGWFVGMQNTVYPMVIAIVMNIINIGASCFLVYGIDLGFTGVALGTLLSNWLGLAVSILCMILFLKRKSLNFRQFLKFLQTAQPSTTNHKPQTTNYQSWSRYFAVNGNLFLRSLFIIFVTMGVTAVGGRISYLTLAVNAIVMQFFQFFSFFMDGFAFSGEAMVGLRAGEKNFFQLGKVVNILLIFTLITGLVFSGLYLLASQPIASLLTDSLPVLENIRCLILWIVLIPIVSCWAFIYDGFYIGITDTHRMMYSSLIGAIIFFAIVSLNFIYADTFSDLTKNRIIWTAFLCYLLARGLYLLLFWHHTLKKWQKTPGML